MEGVSKAADEIEYLYKYGSFDRESAVSLQRAEKVFSEPNLWFSSPSAMNDPFECRPYINIEGTDEQIVMLLYGQFRKRYPEWSFNDVLAHTYHVFSAGAHKADGYSARLSEIIADELATEIGIYCLSERPDSILMWSHYARDHTGYCLQFEATSYTPVFGKAQEVNYCESYPTIKYFEHTPSEQVERAVLSKHIDWSYEREWRIIDHTHGPGYKTYPVELLRSVTFGMNMDEEDKSLIRQWLSARAHDVALYQAVRDQYQFGIRVEQIGIVRPVQEGRLDI